MDNSAVQSQGSISSTSLTIQAALPQGGSSNSSNPPEFVNHGLILWNQTRQRWVGNKKPENQTQQLREPKLSWNATYDSLLGSNKPFRQPIPLATFGNRMAYMTEALKLEEVPFGLIAEIISVHASVGKRRNGMGT